MKSILFFIALIVGMQSFASNISTSYKDVVESNGDDEQLLINNFSLYIQRDINRDSIKMTSYYNVLLEQYDTNMIVRDESFRIVKRRIKNYGLCYIGRFELQQYGPLQKAIYILLNPSRNECYLFNFDKVKVRCGLINLYFNCRGSKSRYTIRYDSGTQQFKLITASQWNDFENQLGKNKFKVILQRK